MSTVRIDILWPRDANKDPFGQTFSDAGEQVFVIEDKALLMGTVKAVSINVLKNEVRAHVEVDVVSVDGDWRTIYAHPNNVFTNTVSAIRALTAANR